jgi:translation elongation factor P/translation initiation factor 5A
LTLFYAGMADKCVMHLDKHPDGTVTLRVELDYATKVCMQVPMTKRRLVRMISAANDALKFMDLATVKKLTRQQRKLEMEQDKTRHD